MGWAFWKSAPKEQQPAPVSEASQSPSPAQAAEAAQAQLPPTPTAPTSRLGLSASQKLIIGGTAFFALSVLVTKRTFARQRAAVVPPFYTTSIYHKPQFNGAKEAFEAFNVATVNVLSLGMLGLGGVMYAMDINSMEDARRVIRGGLGTKNIPRTDEEVEEELQIWLANVLKKQQDRLQKKKGEGEESS
ncbi:hypothetical protein KEM55_002711 [Ascosphaera atra]|nr:hypothetical protein KEM55_002711 [Ascosphaera atra]